MLIFLALGAGAWKIARLSAANEELYRQNRAYASSFAEIEKALEALRQGSLKRGSPAAGFTLLGLDTIVVRFDPATEPGPVHLLFLDPTEENFEGLLENYGQTFGHAEPEARVLILATRGYEEIRAALREVCTPPLHPVAVHASDVYRRYGFTASPGVALIEGGILREKWDLPHRSDQLPLN